MSEEENSDFDYSDNEVIRPRKSRKIHEEDEDEDEDDYSRRNYNSDEVEEDDNIDDEDDEGDDIEETEEDKKFIVDDEGVEEEEEIEEETEISSHKKKKRRKHHSFKDSDSESDLDEDRMLIAENTGIEWQKPEEKRFKRLKKRRQETSIPSRDRAEEDLTKIFMDDEDAEEGEIKQHDDDHEMYDEDDLGDFIDDDEDELTPEMKEQRANERKEQKQFVKDIGESLGITDESLFMIQQIFGDGSEYAYAMDINDMQDEDDVNDINRDNPVRLKDVYEPDEIAEKLLTEEDDAIRIKDVPERIQLKYINNPPEGDELNREAAFIEEKILMKREKYSNNSLQTPIRDVLRFIREDNYEVPFIFSHRKDFWKDENKLNDHELWLIYDYDEEFQAIENKKKLIMSIYENLCNNNSEAKNDKSITESLKQINSIERAQDLLEYIQIIYGSDARNDSQSNEKKLKRPVRVRFYEKMKKAGVGEFVKLFHVKVRELAVSISEGIKKFFPEDEMESPEKLAEKFVVKSNVYLRTPQQIINASKSMLVQEIANEPLFKDYIRHIYEEHAVIDILPTDRGKKEIDENHIYYEFKYITGKPIKEYSTGEPINKVVFLQIVKAEKEGLVTTSIHLENEDQRIDSIYEHIVNDNYNEVAKAWNELRKEVLEKALKDILFPITSDWLKAKIINDACIIVADHCMGKLENSITKAPYNEKILEDYDSEGEYCKVVSISWGDFKINEPGICMAIGSDGKVADHCILEGFHNRNQKAAESSPGAEKLKEFLMHHIPDIIVVGGWTPDLITNRMMDRIRNVADDVSKELNLIRNIPVEIGDDNPAKIYMKSTRGKNEYPLYSPLMLYCVSLARTVQDSLMEYAALCNTDNEISLLRLDPLQPMVPETLMNQRFERSFINAIAHVGVDINRAVQYPEYSNTLQFVSGLGKRKAANIISKITRSGGVILSRSDLIHKNIIGGNIFMNCASFLRIREKYFNQRRSDMFYDVLDDTRIHPEDYDLARKMAADALDVDEQIDDDENPSQHVEELMNGEAYRLDTLLLDAYAEELENNVIHEPKKITLNQIREELQNPYKEKRRKWHPLNEDEIFVMLTGETNDTLSEGMSVSVEITYAAGRTVKGILPSGIEVNIAVENLTGENIRNVEDYVGAGDVLSGKILSVDKERFVVDVTTVPEEVKRELNILHDDYWNYDEERKDKKILSDAYKKATKRITRNIQHPYFKSFDYREAENYLSSRPRGEIVIRPSSKGNDHLAITWKIDDNVYQHLDIQEQGKDGEFKIGKILKVNDTEFTELDELVVVYVEPMARWAEEMMNHPKYKKGTLDDINDYLAVQTKNKPNMAAYAFCITHRKPGYFYLAYKFNSNDRPKHEYIQLQPNGFIFRKTTYSSVDEIIRAFKSNPKGRVMHRSNAHQHYSHSSSMRH
ncbi:transcription elongation factor Spt6 [Piromyces finnis]|uniref:Transcription elongation factor Spt6 n=1 Tax=Piromyces finnis TaxID=1754191 RepID=A0A1Y1VGJ4_9FUNG|nr:transcription elongation factor Spt6 [Piromyces finnis]|eukprot:ORX55479.1 transcription elongation factor Spt6 [Piromyces finnis]